MEKERWPLWQWMYLTSEGKREIREGRAPDEEAAEWEGRNTAKGEGWEYLGVAQIVSSEGDLEIPVDS